MVKISELGSVLLLAQAEQQKRLSLGRLMTPQDVDDAFRGRQPDTHIPPGWVVCGEVHPAFFALVNRQEMQHLGRNYLSPGGTGYVVLAQQIAHWQHRFVLPLLGEEMRSYVAAMQHSELHFRWPTPVLSGPGWCECRTFCAPSRHPPCSRLTPATPADAMRAPADKLTGASTSRVHVVTNEREIG